MVIHDMRSPTNSIQMGIQKVIERISVTDKLNQDHLYYQNKAKVLLQNMISNEFRNENEEIINLENPVDLQNRIKNIC